MWREIRAAAASGDRTCGIWPYNGDFLSREIRQGKDVCGVLEQNDAFAQMLEISEVGHGSSHR